jgi:hypothetical protein
MNIQMVWKVLGSLLAKLFVMVQALLSTCRSFVLGVPKTATEWLLQVLVGSWRFTPSSTKFFVEGVPTATAQSFAIAMQITLTFLSLLITIELVFLGSSAVSMLILTSLTTPTS